MIKRLLVAFAMLGAMAFAPAPVSASSPLGQVAVCSGGASNFFGFQPWYACLQKKYGDTGNKVQFRELSDLFLIIFPVVDWILKAAVFVAAGMIFFMLFKIATSRGNSSQYSTAISGIRDAIIGLVIALISVSILNFVAGAFN